jgi:aminoglycoside phosphotransferase (APT) family kinase protein
VSEAGVDDALLAALADWLASRLGGRPVLVAEGKPGSGYSAENLVLTATFGEDTHRLVLRRDSADAPVYPEQAPGLSTGIGLQHRIMVALTGVVPVADVIGVELDPAVLGVPFFVMRFIDGEVPVEDPPYPAAGFFVDASPSRRAAMVDRGLAMLANLHSVDWHAAGLAELAAPGTRPGAARQLAVWGASLRAGLEGRSSELIEDAMAWLAANLPADPAAPDVVLCWGDARMGNMMWSGAECVCVTDFEGASLGPRELDVGWWLMADRWLHAGVERLDGDPTPAEQLAAYERHAGVSLGDVTWFEVFAALRFATTVVHVMNRWVAKGLVPPDQTIWRDNPATAVLADLLAEASR